ncbi:MAG: class A beta-lactamase-related serine hydrolase, partial [Cytophagales bacterium]|nr:class A beta-lactamase-related serine hydrolase [Cytophagales bacterium]
MEPKSKSSLLFIGFFLIGWLTHSYGQSDSLLLENLMCSDTNSIIKKVMASPDLYRVQVVYSFVEKDEWNCPKVKQYKYRLRNEEYFYPASLVKLPVALLALEWLDKNNLTKDVRLHTKAGTLCTSKPVFPKDTSTISQIIQKSLVVSDNRSFNELYELLGVNYIHT